MKKLSAKKLISVGAILTATLLPLTTRTMKKIEKQKTTQEGVKLFTSERRGTPWIEDLRSIARSVKNLENAINKNTPLIYWLFSWDTKSEESGKNVEIEKAQKNFVANVKKIKSLEHMSIRAFDGRPKISPETENNVWLNDVLRPYMRLKALSERPMMRKQPFKNGEIIIEDRKEKALEFMKYKFGKDNIEILVNNREKNKLAQKFVETCMNIQ